MTIEHDHIASNTSISDVERVVQKLAHTQHQLHQAQEQVNACRSAESEYKSTIEAQQQKLITLTRIAQLRPDQVANSENPQLKQFEMELEEARQQHAKVESDLRSEMISLRVTCENRQNQWTSEKSILEADLRHLRDFIIESERQYQLHIRQQNGLTQDYMQCSAEIIQSLQQHVADTNKINETLQKDILKLSLEKDSLQNKILQMQKMYVKSQHIIKEMSLTHAANARKQDNLISGLRNQLKRTLQQSFGQSHAISIAREEGAPSLEETALIREFNSNLFEKLASCEDEINNLKNQIQILQEELSKSRQEVHNYVRRVKTGALIMETDMHKTDWESSSKIWSTPEERFSLLHKMELLLQETILENAQLQREKNELGEKLLSLHDSIQKQK